jgi:hypothetical protein
MEATCIAMSRACWIAWATAAPELAQTRSGVGETPLDNEAAHEGAQPRDNYPLKVVGAKCRTHRV